MSDDFQPWPGSTASNLPRSVSITEALHLVLDVLRANNLHQTHCQWRLGVEEDRRGRWLAEIPPCNCWLTEETP
jgi:hypothetical protein